MKTTIVKNWTRTILFGYAMFMFPACDQTKEPIGKAETEFQVTDAPSDDASIKSVFVTVVDVKADGQSVSGFSKQTVDLKAYQSGKTKLLVDGQLDARSYGTLTLVLDAETDASGNSPGCYVQTTDNAKYKLSSGTVNLTVSKVWNVTANTKNTFVLDFDLRKSIKAMSDQSVRYNFVSQDNLQASVRILVANKTGTINGSYSEQVATNADKIIVYVYRKDSFDATVETQTQDADAIFFKNAVTSAEVDQSASGKGFILSFMETGDYELHFAAYRKDSGSNTFVLQNLLNAQTTINGTASDFVTVLGSGVTVTISSQITGIL